MSNIKSPPRASPSMLITQHSLSMLPKAVLTDLPHAQPQQMFQTFKKSITNYSSSQILYQRRHASL